MPQGAISGKKLRVAAPPLDSGFGKLPVKIPVAVNLSVQIRCLAQSSVLIVGHRFAEGFVQRIEFFGVGNSEIIARRFARLLIGKLRDPVAGLKMSQHAGIRQPEKPVGDAGHRLFIAVLESNIVFLSAPIHFVNLVNGLRFRAAVGGFSR